MAGSRGYHQPTVEDCPSDEEAANAAARKSPSANVKAKRSNDLGPEKPLAPERPAPSAASDSGYSSHTAATRSSADSAPRLPSQSPPQPVVNPSQKPPSSPAGKRRPTIDGQRKTSSQTSSQTVQNSPRKPLNRSASQSSRQKPRVDKSQVQDCKNPNCKTCVPPSSSSASSRGRRPSGRDSGLDVSFPSSFDQRSQRSDPVTYAPRSPTAAYSRHPAQYAQGPVMIQPSTSRRRSSSQSRSGRPMSYHGEPGAGYWVPGMPQQPYPAPPGPPPSMSAHYNMPPPPPPQMQPQTQYTPSVLGATPPANNYFPPQHAMQTSPPYEGQRPQMLQRTSSQRNAPYSARRPTSQYGAPVVTQNTQNNQKVDPQYSARFAHAGPQSARGTQYSPNEPSDEESEFTSEDELFANAQALNRPVARRAKTTQIYDDRLTHSLTLPERPRPERDPRASAVNSAAPSRSASHSRRPPLAQNKSVSYDHPGNTRVYVESARDRRRQSYVGYEPTYELEDKHRRTKVYPEEPILRRHRADTETRRGDDYEAKMRRSEAHQRSMRGAEVPLTEKALKAARRSSKVITGNSKGSSRHSDEASRASQSRTTVTNGNNGEIRLRVDANAPIKLDFNGDVGEGRTISFNPTDDGMADIVIGSSRGSETAYPSERGSLSAAPPRKAITNGRREAEESSVKSRRSNRSTREDERRPLRRRQGMYHN